MNTTKIRCGSDPYKAVDEILLFKGSLYINLCYYSFFSASQYCGNRY